MSFVTRYRYRIPLLLAQSIVMLNLKSSCRTMKEHRRGEDIFQDESVGRQVVEDLGCPWSEAGRVWAWLAAPPTTTVVRKAVMHNNPGNIFLSPVLRIRNDLFRIYKNRPTICHFLFYTTVLQYTHSKIHRPEIRSNFFCSFIFCWIRIHNTAHHSLH